MTIEFKILEAGDEHVLSRVAPDVFDLPVDERLTAEFLRDPRHHIVVALGEGLVIGFASAVTYIHPDKPAELWINEVGVTPSHRNRGVARTLTELLFGVGRREGCATAWVLTERENGPAMRLYQSCGGEEAQYETVMFSFELGGQGSSRHVG